MATISLSARAIRDTIRLLGSDRILWWPFLITAAAEVILLGLLWLAPHPPFSSFLASPMAALFGGRTLHYPWHLWALYRAMTYTHLLALVVVGAFMAGLACAMVQQVHEGKLVSLRDALIGRQVPYRRMVVLGLCIGLLVHGGPRLLAMAEIPVAWSAWLVLGAGGLLRVVCIHAVPVAVFQRAPWWTAFLRGSLEAVRHPVSTVAVMAGPLAAIILFLRVAPAPRVEEWMLQTTPALVLVFVVWRLLIWTAAEAWMTVGIAHLWWLRREPEPGHGDRDG